MPIAQIQPQYPESAVRKNIEGFVIVEFDVHETGGVINPDVLVSVPAGVFDRASIRALERWRYQPKIIQGKAVPLRGLQTKFNFNIRE
jgi:protein TonB